MPFSKTLDSSRQGAAPVFFFLRHAFFCSARSGLFTLWVIAEKVVLAVRVMAIVSSREPSSILKFGVGVEAIDAFAQARIKMLFIAGLNAGSYPEHDRDGVPSTKCP